MRLACQKLQAIDPPTADVNLLLEGSPTSANLHAVVETGPVSNRFDRHAKPSMAEQSLYKFSAIFPKYALNANLSS